MNTSSAAAHTPSATSYIAEVVHAPIVDMGQTHAEFAGVYAPICEMDKPRAGVTKIFLEEADSYFERFEHFEYTGNNLKRVFDTIAMQPHGIVVDMGAGFGNSTIPLLRTYPDIHIIATDISPNLLAILGTLAKRYGVQDRVQLLACDLMNDYFKPKSVDMVLGVAILHHLIDPTTLVRSSLKSLKSGGVAFFMEPFAEGHALLRRLMLRIRNRYIKKLLLNPFQFKLAHIKLLYCLHAVSAEIDMRTKRDASKRWRNVWRSKDDKWLFTTDYFHDLAKEDGDLQVEYLNLHTSPTPFLNQLKYLLTGVASLPLDAMPKWAWEMAETFEYDEITTEVREKSMLEAAVIIRRK